MATELQTRGRSDDFIQKHHRAALELSSRKQAILVSVSRDFVSNVHDIDNEAYRIIRNAKLAYRGQGKVPPPPPELAALQARRHALVADHVRTLQNSFGPADFVYFDAQVRRYMRVNYKLVSPRFEKP